MSKEKEIAKARRLIIVGMKLIGFLVTGTFAYVTYIFYSINGGVLTYIMGVATFLALIFTLLIRERR